MLTFLFFFFLNSIYFLKLPDFSLLHRYKVAKMNGYESGNFTNLTRLTVFIIPEMSVYQFGHLHRSHLSSYLNAVSPKMLHSLRKKENEEISLNSESECGIPSKHSVFCLSPPPRSDFFLNLAKRPHHLKGD